MMIQETLKKLDTDEAGKLMETLYGAAQAEENKARYRHVAEGFLKEYGDGDVLLFSSPGPDRDQRKPYGSQPRQGAGGKH